MKKNRNCILNFFRRKSIESSNKCEHPDTNDCPYTTENYMECENDKKECVHNEVRKEHKSRKKIISYRVWLFVFIGIAVLLMSCILETIYKDPIPVTIFAIIKGLSISVIAGAVLSFTIDLPNQLRSYQTSFIDALSANNYLKHLDEEKLTKLRKDITELLHKKDVPNMAKGLIDIDEQICNLLRKPYYDRYRQVVNCTFQKEESEEESEEEFIFKKVSIEYKLINPYGDKKRASENIASNNYVFLKEGQKVEDIFKYEHFTINIDGKKERDLLDGLEFSVSDLQREHCFYNKSVKLQYGGETGIVVSFNDFIRVKIIYSIRVNKDDVSYTKRIIHPAKNFRLDYFVTDDNVQVYGQLLGTLKKEADISVNYSGLNRISIETFDWLLPQDGAFVTINRTN